MSPKKISRPLDIYVRVSRVGGRGGDSFISPEVQEEKCRALARARGLKVGQVFIDLDKSGGKMDRPAFKSALERIAEGNSGGIIVARIDRFARTLLGGLQGINAINDLGGVVLTADGEFDTSTATGELVLSIMLSLAQFELRRIRDGWEDAKARARARGVHIGRARAGYVRQADGSLAEHPQHLLAVKDAFELKARGGSMAQVADLLTERGVPTSQGSTVWSREASRKLIKNQAYREVVGEITWRRAQPSKDTARAPRGEGHQLGEGLVRCGTCAAGMVKSSTGSRYPMLRCSRRGSGHAAISYTKAAEYILSQTIQHLGLLLSQLHLGDNGAAIEAAEGRLAQARAELAELEAAEQELSPLAFARALDRARLTLEEAEDALAALERAQGWWSEPYLLTIAGGNLLAFEALSVADQRRFLHEQIERATLKPGRGAAEQRIEIEWRYEPGPGAIEGEGWTVLEFSEQVALAFQGVPPDAPLASETLDALREKALAELRRGAGLRSGASTGHRGG